MTEDDIRARLTQEVERLLGEVAKLEQEKRQDVSIWLRAERDYQAKITRLDALVRRLERGLKEVDAECKAAIAYEPFPDWWRKSHPNATHSDLPMGLRTVSHIKLSMIQDYASEALAAIPPHPFEPQ